MNLGKAFYMLQETQGLGLGLGISPPKAVYHHHKRNTAAVLGLLEVTANKILPRETVGHVHDHTTAFCILIPFLILSHHIKHKATKYITLLACDMSCT